jgi:hypothetical protein
VSDAAVQALSSHVLIGGKENGTVYAEIRAATGGTAPVMIEDLADGRNELSDVPGHLSENVLVRGTLFPTEHALPPFPLKLGVIPSRMGHAWFCVDRVQDSSNP